MLGGIKALPLLVLGALVAVPPPAEGRDARAHGAPGDRRGRVPGTSLLLAAPVLHFEANRGQAEADAVFVARRDGWEASLHPGGARFRLLGGEGALVSLRVLGARSGASATGLDPLPGRSSFFRGNDPSRWVRDVPHFGGVLVPGILPGAGLRWRGLAGGRLRYDFELAAGVDPAAIALRFDGASGLRVDADGALVVGSAGGSMRHSRPVAWQPDAAGARIPVPCSFAIDGPVVRFETGRRNPALPLVIDPTVEVSAFVSGGGVGRGAGAGVDRDGNMVVAGMTRTASFPVKNGYQTGFGGSDDFYIAKFAAGGSTIVWSTFFGGGQQETCLGLALGPDDSPYICGYTTDNVGTFPLKNAVQTTHGGIWDAVVAKLGPAGNTLEYSTLLGGSGYDRAYGVAVDSDGQARVVGSTNSSGFPLSNAIRSSLSGYEGFLVKFSPSGSSLVASTFLGGTLDEEAKAVALDRSGNVWITGSTGSSDFPVASPIQGNLSGGSDAFVMKVNAAHSAILFSTYYGGSAQEYGYAVAVGFDGGAYFGGQSMSTDFPVLGDFQASPVAAGHAYVGRIDGSNYGLSWATSLGGTGSEVARGMAADPDGGVIVVGTTTSGPFPTANPTQADRGGGYDMFISRFPADGSSLTFSTYHGGSGEDEAIAVAAAGDLVLVVGTTRHDSFPSVDGRIGEYISSVASAFAGIHLLPIQMGDFKAALVGESRIDLSWTDPHSGAYAIRVQRRTATGDYSDVASLSAGTLSWSDTTVGEDDIYEYRVRGTSASGDTAWTQGRSARTPPRAPAGLSATAPFNDVVELSWTDSSLVETAYEVYRRTGLYGDFGAPIPLPAGSASFQDGAVEPETLYSYMVATRAPSGAKRDSAVVAVATPPKDPTGLAIVADNDNSVTIAWQDQSSAESGFEIHRRDDDAGGPFLPISPAPPDAEIRIDQGVSGEHGYSYRVRAFNANGASYWTPTASTRTPSPAPTGLGGAALSTDRIALSWVDASQAESGFNVQRMVVGEGVFTTVASLGADTEAMVDGGLLQETEYVYRVRAHNADGKSRWIQSAPIRTPSQIVIGKALRKPAKGARPVVLSVTGLFDHGGAAPDWSMGASLGVGGTAFSIPAFSEKKGTFSYEGEGIRMTLKPAKSGRSAVAFALVVEGAAAEAVDPEGELVLSFAAGSYVASGAARLSGGAFDPKKGRGSWTTPSLWVTSFKASVARPAAHTVALQAAFAPPVPAPTGAPDIKLSIGGSMPLVLDGAQFSAKGGKWVLKYREATSWDAVYDPGKGVLTLKGRQLDLGTYPPGTAAVRIELSVGGLRFVDTPVLATNGKTLSY